MPQFIVDSADIDPDNDRATLRGTEAKHCVAAVRLGPGDPVTITDGAGRRWQGTCAAAKSDRVEVEHLQTLATNEPALRLELLHGLPKGERWDHVLEKGTELGVAAFRPLYTERSVPHIPLARLDKRLGRWQEKMKAAIKQCERSRVPGLEEPISLTHCTELLGPVRDGELRFVLAERRASGPWPDPEEVDTVRLAVGPEGGWASGELELLMAAGFQPLSLGPRILRTDTAALAGTALIMQRWGDLVSPDSQW